MDELEAYGMGSVFVLYAYSTNTDHIHGSQTLHMNQSVLNTRRTTTLDPGCGPYRRVHGNAALDAAGENVCSSLFSLVLEAHVAHLVADPAANAQETAFQGWNRAHKIGQKIRETDERCTTGCRACIVTKR